jgi:membrane-associated phospholipid phosphatase
MHSGLPWLVFLFAFKAWKWKGLPLIAFPIGAWWSAMYLGEHYFVDVLGGIFYATVAFIVVTRALPLLVDRVGFLKKYLPKNSGDAKVLEPAAG